MSLMWSRKRTGPRTVPWGTPNQTASLVDFVPSTTTHCCLSERKESIQFKMFLLTPAEWSLLFSSSWGTVSNAFSKSNIKMSVCLHSLTAVAQSWMTLILPLGRCSHPWLFMATPPSRQISCVGLGRLTSHYPASKASQVQATWFWRKGSILTKKQKILKNCNGKKYQKMNDSLK